MGWNFYTFAVLHLQKTYTPAQGVCASSGLFRPRGPYPFLHTSTLSHILKILSLSIMTASQQALAPAEVWPATGFHDHHHYLSSSTPTWPSRSFFFSGFSAPLLSLTCPPVLWVVLQKVSRGSWELGSATSAVVPVAANTSRQQ